MPKVHVKKKRYQANCRAQVVKGLINDAEGRWVPAPSLGGKSIDIFAGYHLTKSKRKKAKQPAIVE